MTERLGHLHAYDLEGIFRQSSAASEKQYYLDHINRGEYHVIHQITDGYLVADVMKRIFFLMVDPFIPYSFYKEIVQQEAFTKEYCREIVARLSPTRQAVIHFITDLVTVSLRHPSNQMTAHSFGICWAPSLMRT